MIILAIWWELAWWWSTFLSEQLNWWLDSSAARHWANLWNPYFCKLTIIIMREAIIQCCWKMKKNYLDKEFLMSFFKVYFECNPQYSHFDIHYRAKKTNRIEKWKNTDLTKRQINNEYKQVNVMNALLLSVVDFFFFYVSSYAQYFNKDGISILYSSMYAIVRCLEFAIHFKIHEIHGIYKHEKGWRSFKRK